MPGKKGKGCGRGHLFPSLWSIWAHENFVRKFIGYCLAHLWDKHRNIVMGNSESTLKSLVAAAGGQKPQGDSQL